MRYGLTAHSDSTVQRHLGRLAKVEDVGSQKERHEQR